MLFILPEKLFLFSRYLNFGHVILFHVEKRIDKMDNVNFKIYLVITWETITIHILPKISRCKGNQIMKFSQIIKYNTKKFHLEKS